MITLTQKHIVYLIRNTRIPGKTMALHKALRLSLRVAERLSMAGYTFNNIVPSKHGFVLNTTCRRRPVRFALLPAGRFTMVGAITGAIGETLGVIQVSKTLILVISDTDEAFPSLTLSL